MKKSKVVIMKRRSTDEPKVPPAGPQTMNVEVEFFTITKEYKLSEFDAKTETERK